MPGPKERDLEATRAALAKWLGEKLGAPVALSELTGPSDTGFSSDTLLFDATVGGDRTEQLVARLEPQGFNVFPEYDVAVQYRVMETLAGTDVPVPRMRWLESDPSVLGAAFYVMDRVDGQVPSDSPPYHLAGLVFEMEPEARTALWWSGLEAMARIHRLDWRVLGFDFLDEPERGPDPLAQQLDYYHGFFQWAVNDPDRYPLIQRALAWLSANAPKDEPVALCWGDSRISNQMFRDGACVAVIDWEMVRLGNPLQDVVWMSAIDRCLSEGIGVARLPGLPDRAATLARWSELTGFATEAADYYEVLALLKFSVIMARLGLQMKHYGVLPEDADMDRENLATTLLGPALEAAGG